MNTEQKYSSFYNMSIYYQNRRIPSLFLSSSVGKPSYHCRKPDVNDKVDRKVDISAQYYPAGKRYQALMSQRYDKAAPTERWTFCLRNCKNIQKEKCSSICEYSDAQQNGSYKDRA